MLLSRVADALYWMSRYLERAEHTARLIDVAIDHGLGRASPAEGTAIERLYQSVGLDQPGHPTALAGMALFDPANRNSVAACITTARDNARQVREEISSELHAGSQSPAALFVMFTPVCPDAALITKISAFPPMSFT
jgi:uncharacterized alpha-E superfamily protein